MKWLRCSRIMWSLTMLVGDLVEVYSARIHEWLSGVVVDCKGSFIYVSLGYSLNCGFAYNTEGSSWRRC